MNTKSDNSRDVFAFSLGGLSTKSSFALTPAVGHGRIRKAFDEKLSQVPDDQPDTETEMQSFWGRLWLRAFRRAA